MIFFVLSIILSVENPNVSSTSFPFADFPKVSIDIIVSLFLVYFCHPNPIPASIEIINLDLFEIISSCYSLVSSSKISQQGIETTLTLY